MNNTALAYSTLQLVIEDWASECEGLIIKHPDILARNTADYVFDELLMIPVEEIETED